MVLHQDEPGRLAFPVNMTSLIDLRLLIPTVASPEPPMACDSKPWGRGTSHTHRHRRCRSSARLHAAAIRVSVETPVPLDKPDSRRTRRVPRSTHGLSAATLCSVDATVPCARHRRRPIAPARFHSLWGGGSNGRASGTSNAHKAPERFTIVEFYDNAHADEQAL
jgi:hypothetical protein